MSERPIQPKEYIAPIPYPLCDALLKHFLSGTQVILPQMNLTSRRRTLTSGSCVYILYMKSIPIGRIDLRYTTGNQTYLTTSAEDKQKEEGQLLSLEVILSMFWTICEGTLGHDQAAPLLSSLPLVQDLVSDMQDLIPRTIADAQTPKRGDSLDTWLDWRDKERKEGRRHTLEYIAEQGGFTLISVKRASAERKPRGTKK